MPVLLRRFIAPLAALILGAASIGLLVFTNRIHEQLHMYFLYDDMIHEVQISLLKAHLALEELRHRDPLVDVGDAGKNVDMAFKAINTMLVGGETYHNKIVPVLVDTELREGLYDIRSLIAELQKDSKERKSGVIKGAVDQRYDRKFYDLIAKTDVVIESFEHSLFTYERRLYNFFIVILITWATILLVATLGMFFLMKRRNRAECLLRKSEEHFRSVADTALDAIVTVDSQGKIVYWNRAAENIFGYSVAEAMGNSVTIIMSEREDAEHDWKFDDAGTADKSCLTDSHVERAGVRKDGSVVPIEISLSNWETDGEIFFTGIIRDITERREKDRLLQISRERYRSVVDAQTDLVCRWKRDGTLTFVNDAFCRYFGLPRDELVGSDFLSFVDDREFDNVRKQIALITRQDPIVSYTHRVILPGGIQRWQQWTTRAFFGGTSGIEEYQSVGQDITERKLAEEELEKHREHLAEMVEERTAELTESYKRLGEEIEERRRAEEQAKNMALFAELNPSPVFRFAMDGSVLMANPAALEILDGRTPIGMPIESVIPGIEHIDLTKCIREGNVFTHSMRIRDRYFHFVFRGVPSLCAGFLYVNDITDQKKAEAETVRASQLASLGELAAGVAHEINNPINGIINYAQIIADMFEDGSKENDMARQIIDEGDRIAGIVTSLLLFVRQDHDDKASVSIRDILAECMSLLNAQMQKEGITIEQNIPPHLSPVFGHFQKIEQVFLNIMNNARYAVNEKYAGRHDDKVITITGSSVEIEGKPYVRVIFHDRGVGIPDGVLDKVINPFFSTKAKGSGTGLGLSISHSIIKNHDGRLSIESSEGEYTKVIIDLPCTTVGKNRKDGAAERPASRIDRSASGMKKQKR